MHVHRPGSEFFEILAVNLFFVQNHTSYDQKKSDHYRKSEIEEQRNPLLTPNMKAAHLANWCAKGTVADTILFGDVAVSASPEKTKMVIQVKASATNSR